MKIRRIEWFALVLIVLWFIALLVPKYLRLFVMPANATVEELGNFKPFMMLIVWSQFLIEKIVDIGIAVGLFIVARRGKETPWVWALLGLLYGLVAPLLFYVVRIYDRLESQAKEG